MRPSDGKFDGRSMRERKRTNQLNLRLSAEHISALQDIAAFIRGETLSKTMEWLIREKWEHIAPHLRDQGWLDETYEGPFANTPTPPSESDRR